MQNISAFKTPHEIDISWQHSFKAGVAHLHMAKLALDHSKWMLYLGPDASPELFSLVGQGAGFIFSVERFAFAWARGHMPCDIFCGVCTLLNALVTRIAKRDAFLAIQQAVGRSEVNDIPLDAAHGMHQAKRLTINRIRSDMGIV